MKQMTMDNRNPAVQGMIDILRTVIGVKGFIDDDKWQRIWAKHLVDFGNKVGKDEFIRRLRILIKDPWKLQQCNRIKMIYMYVVKGWIEPPKPKTFNYDADKGVSKQISNV